MQLIDFFYIVDPVQAMQTNYHIHYVYTTACCVKGQTILKNSIQCLIKYNILPAKTMNKG